MLGYVMGQGRGTADTLLADVARALQAEGWPLAGVVQINTEIDPARPCQMDLLPLQGGARIRISQSLGPMSQGCRLDVAGLEQAAGLVAAVLEADEPPRLLIVNKFGKQECEGRGFRPLIGRALERGVPVLTAVSAANHIGFCAFAEGLAEPLASDLGSVLGWCRATVSRDA